MELINKIFGKAENPKEDLSDLAFTKSLLENNEIYRDDLLCLDFFQSKVPNSYLEDEEEIKHLLTMVYRRYIWHLTRVRKSKRIYGDRANFLSSAIPIYSAILTFFLTTDLFDMLLGKDGAMFSTPFLSIMGFGLTVMTILDSSWQPHEKSVELSNILISLNSWLMDFNVKITEIIHNDKDERDNFRSMLMTLIMQKDEEMTEIGKKILITINKSAYKG